MNWPPTGWTSLAGTFATVGSSAQSDQKPLPEIQPFIRRVIAAGYRLLPLGAANNYLQNCRGKDTTPDPETLLSVILPSAGKVRPAGSRG